MTHENIKTIYDAVFLFRESALVKRNPHLWGNLRTVLKLYILPSFEFSPSTLDHPTKLDKALGKVLIKDFIKNGIAYFEQTAQTLMEKGVKKATVRNYQSAIQRFMNWMKEESWYSDVAGLNDGKYTPRLKAKVSYRKNRQYQRCYNEFCYSLKPADFTPKIQKQKTQFEKFWTDKERPDRKDPQMRGTTLESRWISIASFLGWLHRVEDVPVEDLDITQITNIPKLSYFIAWGINERGNGYAWAMNIAKAALCVAKWKYGPDSVKPHYQDIEEIEAIRLKMNELESKRKTEPKRSASPEALKEKLLSLEQCLEVICYLKRCCAPRTKGYVKRPEIAIIQSWQRYLLISILTFCPVRQRELRELEVGRTLFREQDGYWVKLSPDDHKTGSKTGKGREYPLPAELTADLDEWLGVWRPKIPTEHNLVFISLPNAKNKTPGQPLNKHTLGSLVTRTMFNATDYLFGEAKRTTPQDFRRIAITWMYKSGDPNQREALAEVMGHSVKVAMTIYSQLTSKDVTEKAKDWWKHKSPESDD